MRVLVTRPIEQAQTTASALTRLGHDPVLAPLTQVVSLNAPFPFDRVDAVLATSARIFDGSADRLAALNQRPLFVVGEKTATRARASGFAQIEAIAADARSLAGHLASTPMVWEWLYLAGDPRTPDLEEWMKRTGRRLTLAVLYQARPASDLPQAARMALERGALDAALHYSSRSAATFVRLADRAGLLESASALRHVALSGRVADGLGALREGARVAEAPNEESLLRALDRD
jgi:uroporphyrinogen-III synthase